jgi:hypothetical protein
MRRWADLVVARLDDPLVFDVLGLGCTVNADGHQVGA